MRILPLIFVVLVSFFFCTSDPSQNNSTSSISQDKKVFIGFLVNESVSTSDNGITLGSIDNLDIIYGFKKLKFNTRFESISFRNFDINDKYESKGIIIVSVHGLDISLFGNKDELILSFYNDKLYEIIIYGQLNYKYEQFTHSKSKNGEFNTTIGDLIGFYGKPTRTIPSNETSPDPDGMFWNNPEYEWETSKIRLNYKNSRMGFRTGQTTYDIRETSSVTYSLLENEKIITESIKSFDEYDELNKDKRRDEELEKSYRKKF